MKEFDKYTTRSADYHYDQIDRGSIKKYNAQVAARFETLVENVDRIASNRTLKLLDVGCGDGVALYLLSKSSPHLELYGVEPVKEALEVAKRKIPKAYIEEGRADKLPFEDNFFDIIISSDVIEHVADPDKMLEEIRRVAKDGAKIIVGTPIKHSKTPLDHNHVQEFFAEDFQILMSQHFRDTELHESHNLAPVLLYNQPTHSFLNFRYLINFLDLTLRYNPFKKERVNKIQMFAYMYVVCQK